ncbi:hypothetical protein ACKF11_13395 [Methylobacillus sp. Pita2]|uniref:hypothetical protein n=1 Tax=Methylobacillus sp. Pita2 TaxID=3383245 RepID=UPI0038B4A986
MQINDILNNIANALRQKNLHLDDIVRQRYIQNKSMKLIGESLGLSAQSIRVRIAQIWQHVELEQPEILESINQMNDDLPGTFLTRDFKNYTSIHNSLTAKTPSGDSVITFNVGVRSNLNTMTTIKRILVSGKKLPLDEHLLKIFGALGERGQMCIQRYGIGLDRDKTLDELGVAFKLTKQRVHQIITSITKMIYLAEQEAGFGPITSIALKAHTSCPKGSFQVVNLESLLKDLGATKLHAHGTAYMLAVLDIEYHVFDGVTYVKDPFLTPAMVLKEIRRERILKRGELREAKRKDSKQVMLVTEIGLMNALRARYSHLSKLSNGDLISRLVTREDAMLVEVANTDWKGINTQTEPCTPRITMKAFKMFEEVAAKRKVTKNDLMASCIRHLVYQKDLVAA